MRRRFFDNPDCPRPRPGTDGFSHTFVPSSSRLLSVEEEQSLVARLGAIRKRIDAKVRPLVEPRATDKDRIGHFDQLMAFFHQQKAIPAKIKGQVARWMKEYALLKHQLVVCNLPWVTKLARAGRKSGISEEDLFQEGVCGLLKAIDRFEPERELRLMTYATWYIREAMQQIRARQSHLLSLSAHDQTLTHQMEQLKGEFQQRESRPPTNAELARQLDRPASLIRKLQSATAPALSLDHGGANGTIPVVMEDPVDEFDRLDDIKSSIHRLLQELSHRERVIVMRRFGLDGSEPTSLEAIGSLLQISKERVRQLQRQAIRRMQQLAKESPLGIIRA